MFFEDDFQCVTNAIHSLVGQYRTATKQSELIRNVSVSIPRDGAHTAFTLFLTSRVDIKDNAVSFCSYIFVGNEHVYGLGLFK